ncbi:uncharacterized protein LOC124290054 [Haliotis rubra]|uniref:uncharacterized protein LOC124290054 n=1 Tax=Haliotis rubra TaxID=36100 RepID=UPI001EE5C074|nr:uncharacterized protein LOC124290054 [Haliotis rubra]
MSSFLIVTVLLVGVSCQHHNHNSHEIYTNVIGDVWLSSDANGDGIFERYELTGVFAHYDDNGDHIITHHEYMDSVPSHSPLKEYTHAVFKEFDANDDNRHRYWTHGKKYGHRYRLSFKNGSRR